MRGMGAGLFGGGVLVMFSLRMASSSRTLSISRRLSRSTTITFHYKRIVLS